MEDMEDSLDGSWSALEVARAIYSKDPSSKIQLAEVHLYLGDVSMESGTYS
jgi:hypothetical protein